MVYVKTVIDISSISKPDRADSWRVWPMHIGDNASGYITDGHGESTNLSFITSTRGELAAICSLVYRYRNVRLCIAASGELTALLQ